jgi:hypothetical protein
VTITLDTFLWIAAAAIPFVMGALGGHVSSHRPIFRRLFWGLGIAGAVIVIWAGIRNQNTEARLQKQLNTIQKNTETPPNITVQPAPVTVIAPSQTPLSNEPPQITVERIPEKPAVGGNPLFGTDKPGEALLITAKNGFSNPAFEIECNIPCSFVQTSTQAIGTDTGTWTDVQESPHGSSNIFRIRFRTPNRLSAGNQIALDFRSKDDRQLTILRVLPYQPKI